MLYKSDRSVHLYYEKDKNFAQNKFDWWKSNLVLLILFTPRSYT